MSERVIQENAPDPDVGAAAMSFYEDEKPVEEVAEKPAVEPTEEAPAVEESPAVDEKEAPTQEAVESEEEAPEGEEDVISTLPELIESVEGNQEWADGLKVPIKVNDETSEVTLKELVANYQMGAAGEKFLQEAKNERAQAKQERAQVQDGAATQLGVAAKLMEWVGKEIDGQQNTQELEALRDSDPAEYAATIADIQARKQRFEDAKTEAFNVLQAEAQQRAQTTALTGNEHNVQRFNTLVETIPEWQESGEKAQTEYLKVGEYLVAQGFPVEDVLVASDHRHFLVARKAMLYDAIKAKSDAPAKKVPAKVPRVVRPGGKGAGNAKDPNEKSTQELFYGTG